MNELFGKIAARLAAGQSAVLVTIIAGSGSTPRGAGAKMAVFPGGESIGTIGGGAVEFEAQKLAAKALEDKAPFIREFTLAPNDVADLGMICGGAVTVYFQYLDAEKPETAAFFEGVAALAAIPRESWLVTRIGQGGEWAACAVNEKHDVVASYGGLDDADALPQGVLCGRSVLVAQEGAQVYGEPLARAGHVYIFGGGHVSQQLVPVLNRVFFPCVVIDDLPAFVAPALFPDASGLVLADFDKAFGQITVTDSDYVVIVTRGHQHDKTVLAAALQTPACYIGMIGSRRKIDATYENLIRNGVMHVADIKRVHSPIGLPIGGETPEEIAISIAAQLIAVRTQKNGGK